MHSIDRTNRGEQRVNKLPNNMIPRRKRSCHIDHVDRMQGNIVENFADVPTAERDSLQRVLHMRAQPHSTVRRP